MSDEAWARDLAAAEATHADLARPSAIRRSPPSSLIAAFAATTRSPPARWKSPDGFGGVLHALDEVRPGFSSRFDDAAAATQAVPDLGVRQRDELQAVQCQAAADAIAANRRSAAALQADKA